MKDQLDALIEQLRGLWRFRWIGVSIAWAVFLFGLAVVVALPDQYKASATVFVDTQTALGAATRDITVDSSVDSQIQRVREALLGGPQLTKIADAAGLTVNAITPKERQAVVEKLRSKIEIEGGFSREASGAGVYLISYTHAERETSLKVVDMVVSTFVEEALGGKREGSEQAQQFLIEQIAEHERQLRQQEDRLAEFKKKNVALMPGAQGDYFTRLQADMDELSRLRTKLAVSTRKRDELRRQLSGEQPLLTGGAAHAGGGQLLGGDTSMRLRESQQRLDALLLRFTEKHPEVIALRAAIKELDQKQKEEVEAARRGDAAAVAKSGLSMSPVYQSLQLQLNEVEVEIAATQADIADRDRHMATLKGLIDTAPEVEAEFSRLNRDNAVIKASYESLVERLGRARLGEQAAQTGVIRFEVIDPPRAGFEPAFPNRPLLAIAVLVASLGAGGGATFVLNLIRPVFSGVRQLHERTGQVVLGAVSMTWVEQHNTRVRWAVAYVIGAIVLMVVVCSAFVLSQHTLVQLFQSWVGR